MVETVIPEKAEMTTLTLNAIPFSESIKNVLMIRAVQDSCGGCGGEEVLRGATAGGKMCPATEGRSPAVVAMPTRADEESPGLHRHRYL